MLTVWVDGMVVVKLIPNQQKKKNEYIKSFELFFSWKWNKHEGIFILLCGTFCTIKKKSQHSMLLQ